MNAVNSSVLPSVAQVEGAWHWQRSVGRLLGCASIVALLTACSSFTKQSATPSVLAQLRAEPLAQTVGDPRFRFLTSQDGLKFAVVATFTGGLLGGAVLNDSASTKGQELSELGGMTDPGRKVADTLAARLKSSFQIPTLVPVGISESDDVGHILKVAPSSAAFVLDVRTGAWGGTYLPTQWNRYRLAYSLKARLIDRARKAVVAEGFCDYQNRSEATPPSYEDLIADRAAMIRQRMDAYAAECAEEVWAHMFPASIMQAPVAQISKPVAVAAVAAPAAAAQTTALVPSQVKPVPIVAPAISRAAEAPAMSKQAEQRYQIYLTKPNPKAFAVSDNGDAWMSWGESLNPTVKESIPQRAVRGCEERSRARCVLYSVNGNLVSGQGVDSKR
ncbi:hypothetical protein [Ideonella paludis]|uniref:Lipoprotein n=1 Tax=Ideonella paludis TaxID=1233411 RepID=A0ABS5E371_9BURK|nr:hypothetical protein [Ideonella paludis]MBQ0937754.1 hypothetical protein [Ideonella paludis]